MIGYILKVVNYKEEKIHSMGINQRKLKKLLARHYYLLDLK